METPGAAARREFLQYVISTRALVDMVEGAASFSVHVSGRMRQTYERIGGSELEEFDSGPVASMARTAEEEIASGFPLLHGHTLVGLWGALEACMEDLCVSWLSRPAPDAVAGYLSNVKVPLGDFLLREGDDRWRWVLLQIENAKGSALKRGVGQFESVLDQIGLGGTLDDQIRDVIFYSKALRNLYAHQAGRADGRFVEDCPVFGAVVGERVPVSFTQLTAAFTAMVLYVDTVLDRVRVAVGESPHGVELPPWVTSHADLLRMMLPAAASEVASES